MIVFCGCSYLSGYGIENKDSTASLLGEHLGCEVINLSKPGASNYCINKQVEHAISLNPDLIVFGTTEILRFDWIVPGMSLNSAPTVFDFSYNSYATGSMNKKSKIMSESFRTLDNYLSGTNLQKYTVEKYRNIDKEYLKTLHNYLTYTDFHLKKDQDKKIVESSMFNLIRSKVKWLLIDGNDFFDDPGPNILRKNWRELVEFDPQNDNLHFAERGNQLLADIIKEKI